MQPWSRYNTLFRSERYGWFLHNTLSGVMLELDESHASIAESLRDGSLPSSAEPAGFIALLEQNGFLADPGKERLKLMENRYWRNAACFSTTHLGLTICPTLSCNFACPYCFEHSQGDATVMDEGTIEALVAFIRKHGDAKHLTVRWYGGEPTLAFGIIETLTAKFIELFPDYAGAGMVTNGYLLDQEKIERLNDLKIASVQITLDGTEETHDRRRIHSNGEGTYQQIIKNIDLLMNSSWNGSCAVRVNVDRTNRHEYAVLRKELLDRYKGRNLTVYPGHVNTDDGNSCDRQCSLCNREWAAFQLDGYAIEGITPRGGLYPPSGIQNLCIATSLQGYVVGPKGELYKCWEDVGREGMVIGTVHDEQYVTNPELLVRYSIGTDPYGDSECMECKVFPVCGGGCVNRRMRVQQFGESSLEYCSSLKESLEKYLDAYMDKWHTNQICKVVLGKGRPPSMENGYRMVQPEMKMRNEVKNPLEPLTGHEQEGSGNNGAPNKTGASLLF
ncbi:MAG: radical SAM protein [Chlorobiaceae bacterium]|nr:radical SAM protein [Chlorobiaceae bacterium]